MDAAHHLILLGGALGLLGIGAGLLSARFGIPLLLAFLGLGMLAGRDGPGGIVFDDFRAAYLIGSLAIAIILFEGGLKTRRPALRVALWPGLGLATVGVVVTATVVAGVFLFFMTPPWPYPLWTLAVLIGATLAPTDAAAVAMLLRRARAAVPERVAAALEIESGLNDPMSVCLTLLVTEYLLAPSGITVGHALLLLAKGIVGGAVIGLGGGVALLVALHRIRAEAAMRPALALVGALTLFGVAQSLGTSGFLAVYLAGMVLGSAAAKPGRAVEHFFEALGWLSQIVLFLMLGLLVPAGALPILAPPVLAIAATLIFVARPVATFVCLAPFRFTLRETGFASWVGLRGAVPIYLVIIPLLTGLRETEYLLAPTFVVVVISLVVQGWTIAPVARLLWNVKGKT